MKVSTKVRTRIRTRHIQNRFKAGRDKALDKVGSMIRQSAKKQFSVRGYKKKPIWKRVGDLDGYPLVSMSFQDSKPGKVTSWKPKSFLRSKILYSRDDRRGSVVIGPDDKVKDVQILHERGGSKGVKFVLIRQAPTEGVFQYRVPKSLVSNGPQGRDKRGRFISNRLAYVGRWVSTGKRVKGRVVARDPGRAPAGRYMEKGLKAKKPAIPQAFRNQITGP